MEDDVLNITNNDIKSHPLISDTIKTSEDFNADPYTYVNEVKNACEEHLLFIIHGIGQDSTYLKSTLLKIKNNINNIYAKKSQLLKKQLHIRMIDWKSLLLAKEKDLMNNLVDRNNDTKYPKMFIQQTPIDVLHYLFSRNKYNIMNDVIEQMNVYYELVKKLRPLFKGNVSVAGHSLGTVIMYDILTNMSVENKIKNNIHFEDKIEILDLSPEKNENEKNEQNCKNGILSDNSNMENSKISENSKNSENFENLKIPNSEKKKSVYKYNTLELTNLHLNNNNEENKNINIIKIDRKNRNKNFKISDVIKMDNIDIDTDHLHIKNKFGKKLSKTSNEINNQCEYECNSNNNENESTKKYTIISKHQNILPLTFLIDHFFLLGSPLSLFLTVEHGMNSFLQDMEIVNDYHNIIHPMDPVAYRIEPLIYNYPETKNSFTLPHYENEGLRHIILYRLANFFTCESSKNIEDSYFDYDKNIKRKRYDFMVQETFSEKAVNMIGFLFSHMTYWNNPDVFYFITKMVHWQGYSNVNKNMN